MYLGILATFKNEAMILKEWIEHHKWQGFDHIFLINNDSDDDYMNILKPYIKSGYITLYNLPGKYQQVNNYNIVFQLIHNSIKWLAVSDIDEYWYTPNNNVKTYIESIDERGVDILYTRWYSFGSSGYVDQPPNIRTSFIMRSNDVGSIKAIVKTSHVNFLDIHQHNFKEDSAVMVDYTNIRLNHYRVMSEEYFRKTKLVRGSPSGYPSLDICDTYRDEKYFKENDTNDIKDTTLANLVPKDSIGVLNDGRKQQSASTNTLKQFLKTNKL